MDTTHPDRLSVALSLLVNPAGHWIQCGIGWPLLGGLMYWTIPARQRLDRGAWGELPGYLKTQIVQGMGGRYSRRYQRLIKLYFESIAERAALKREQAKPKE